MRWQKHCACSLAVSLLLCLVSGASTGIGTEECEHDGLNKPEFLPLLGNNAMASRSARILSHGHIVSGAGSPLMSKRLTLQNPGLTRLSMADRRMMSTYAAVGNPHNFYDFNENEALALGKGASGFVFRATEKSNKTAVYAIKRIVFGDTEVVPAFVLRELEIFSMTKSVPFGTRMHNAFLVLDKPDVADTLYIVMNFVNGGSLGDLVERHERLSEGMLRNTVRGVLSFLSHMHTHRIMHRDIKPDNILVDDDMNPTVCDYGLGYVFFSEDAPVLEGNMLAVGTPFYFSPELVGNGSHYSYGVDVWAFGITAMILATGHTPYDSWPEAHEYSATNRKEKFLARVQGLKKGFLAESLFGVTPELRNFLEQCLEPNPLHRPSAETLLKHPFLVGTSLSAKSGYDTCSFVYSCISCCMPRRKSSHDY